ncbi:hypothetical protein THAOC_03991, partial [Thalassiosira oceanica]
IGIGARILSNNFVT